jgi:hypothetical protein
MILMETTRKYFFDSEETAEAFVEQVKETTAGMVIDYKISNKETKDSEYTILTIKERFKTLAEAKSSQE